MSEEKSNNLCIGLFGTCGGSQWRTPFKQAYDVANVRYFDPQKEGWHPEDAAIEARHLSEDGIILFPVTSETYGMGSLSEVGFSITQAIRLDDRRDILVLIDRQLDPRLVEDNPALAKASLQARALVYEHLRKLRLPNVYVMESMEHMLTASFTLYQSNKLKQGLSKYNPHNLA